MFEFVTNDRRNKIHRWSPSDRLEDYKTTNSGGLNYSINDFDYRYNSDGFRCDEFSAHSDLPILFLGCSFTEGIGLPLHHCWPHFLLEKIRAMPENIGKQIPFHSLALGGSGIDTAARLLVKYIDVVKPKYIFFHSSSIYRREFCLDNTRIHFWLPNFSDPMINPEYCKMINHIHSDKTYAKFSFFKGLETINLAAKLYNSKVFMINHDVDKTIRNEELTDELFSNIRFMHPDKFQFDYSDPAITDVPELARDNFHPGARWQSGLANIAWIKFINDANTEVDHIPHTKVMQREAKVFK